MDRYIEKHLHVLKNFAKLTGNHLCWSLFFNKVAGLRPAILSKERLQHRCFPVNFAKLLIIPFLTEHLRMIASETCIKRTSSIKNIKKMYAVTSETVLRITECQQ